MIPNVIHLFLGLRDKRLSKGGGKGGWGEGRREGDSNYFSFARAHSCARIPFPFPFEGLPLTLSFFFIVYNVDVICAFVSYLHIIQRNKRNQSIHKSCFVLSSFFLPS